MLSNIFFIYFFLICLGKITEDLSKTAKGAAESLAGKSQALGQTSAFKTISQVKYITY